jgi:4-amino-4-deoxy-L-arabinose transferase-like glycosyltransferase
MTTLDLPRPASQPFSLFEWLLIGVSAWILAMKLIFTVYAAPFPDEAYYWLWGQHFQLSYFDHPPLQGWLQGLSHALFGRSLLALRWMTLACLALIVWIFWLTAGRVAPDNRRPMFLKTTAAYFASPLFGFFGSVVFNDYLMVALMLASGYLFFCFLGDVEQQGRGRLRDLFAAAILLALAALAKYPGAYLGLAVAGAVLTRPRLRVLLTSWPIYAAGVLALAIQAPVILWNLLNNFASFRFHLVDRNQGGGFHGLDLQSVLASWPEAVMMLSPFLIPAIWRFFMSKPALPFERLGKVLAIWCFWLSSLTFFYVSNYAWVLWWWNIAALVLLLPFLGKHIGRIALGLHLVWGVCVNTIYLLNYALVPTTALGWPSVFGTETHYGWGEISAAIKDAVAEYHPDFIATNRYHTSSQLAFALDDPTITALSTRVDQFDFWFDPEAHQGERAIVLVYPSDDTESFRHAFANLTKLRDIEAKWGEHHLATYELYLGEGFTGFGDPYRGP